MGQKQETIFDIQSLFKEINRSFTDAALALHSTFAQEEWQDQPFIYRMPKLQMEIKLELSHSNGKVKGVFRKRSTQQREELASTIKVDVVAVPRVPATE